MQGVCHEAVAGSLLESSRRAAGAINPRDLAPARHHLWIHYVGRLAFEKSHNIIHPYRNLPDRMHLVSSLRRAE